MEQVTHVKLIAGDKVNVHFMSTLCSGGILTRAATSRARSSARRWQRSASRRARRRLTTSSTRGTPTGEHGVHGLARLAGFVRSLQEGRICEVFASLANVCTRDTLRVVLTCRQGAEQGSARSFATRLKAWQFKAQTPESQRLHHEHQANSSVLIAYRRLLLKTGDVRLLRADLLTGGLGVRPIKGTQCREPSDEDLAAQVPSTPRDRRVGVAFACALRTHRSSNDVFSSGAVHICMSIRTIRRGWSCRLLASRDLLA
eukprot:1169375-Pleurochrysis_carterae.AAC.1